MRCPYCHTDIADGEARATCRACHAAAHEPCSIELGRCGACGRGEFERSGAGDVEGWVLIEATGGPAYVRIAPRELAAREGPGSPTLALDLASREARADGVIAGDVKLSVVEPELLSALRVELLRERTRGFLGRVVRELSTLRAFALAGAAASGLGLYAPGVYRASFRIPLRGVPLTRDEPGAAVHERTILSLRLERAGAPLVASVEVRVLPVVASTEPVA